MKSCLIVDDSKVIRMVARKMLEDLNFEIEEAENGQKALDACLRKMPDAILLDWNMPVMSGIDFLKELRKASGILRRHASNAFWPFSAFESNPSTLDDAWRDVTEGIYQLEDKLMVKLDIDRLLNFDRAQNE